MASVRELERGIRLDESAIADRDVRNDVESLCYLLGTCVADLVVSLSMFERAQLQAHAEMEALRDSHHDMSKWEQEAQLERERVSKLEAAAGLVWGARDYFERSREIGEQARREALHEKWDREGGPESYRRRRVFIPAEAFVSTLAVLQRTILTLSRFELGPDIDSGIKQAADDLARALPGLKGVRDSVAHKDERVRGLAYKKKIETQPVSNALIHAPAGGAMIIGSLNNNNYGGTIADGNYAEVEIADATTEVARQAVQAVYDALPWRRGHRLLEPIS